MQIWTSAQAGAGFRQAGDRFETWFGGVAEPTLLSRRQAFDLFSGCNDVEQGTFSSVAGARSHIDDLWRRDRALRFLLILLDPEEELSELGEVRFCLENLLKFEPVYNYCFGQLSAEPLPSGNRAPLLANPDFGAQISKFASEILELQGEVAAVRGAFDRIPESVLSEQERVALLEAALDRGAFTLLAKAFQAGKDTRFTILEVQQVLRGSTPNANQAIAAWLGTAMPAKLGYRHERAEAEKTYNPPQLGGGASHARFQNVLAQQAEIRSLLRRGEVARARAYADDLVAQQESENSEFAAKSLCSLAQEAKRFGLTNLHYEWSSRAVELRPEDAWAQGQKADGLITLGRFNEATSALDVAEAMHPSFVATNRARIQRRMGHLDEALAAYIEARERFEGSDDIYYAWMGIADVMREMGDLDEALRVYDEALGLFPGEAAISSGRASVLAELGRFSEAQQGLRVALALSNENINSLTSLALVYREKGDFSKSLSVYDDILKKFPDEPVVLCGRAEVLRLDGRLSDALDAYSKAIIEFPFVESAYVGKGRVLIQQGKYDEAGIFYAEAFERFPDSLHLTSGYAGLSSRMGRWHEALAAYDKIVRRSARNLRARLEKARVLNRMGQPDLAEIELAAILERAPNHRGARNELAASYYLKGEYSKAVDLTPGSFQPRGVNDWARLFVRAIALDKLNDTAEANRILLIGTRSAIPRVRRYMASALAVLLMSQNKLPEAKELVRAADGEASSLVKMHVDAAIGGQNAPVVSDSEYALPVEHVEIRKEIVRRFAVIEGGRAKVQSEDWLFDAERRLLLFDATADDWLLAA